MLSPRFRIGAPAALGCDTPGRRRYRLAARSLARGPILSNSLHDPGCEASDRLPAIVPVAPSLGQLGAPGFGRGASLIRSQRGTSCQMIRASQHPNVSHSLPMLEVEQKEIPQCGTMIPSSRSIMPSARWST